MLDLNINLNLACIKRPNLDQILIQHAIQVESKYKSKFDISKGTNFRSNIDPACPMSWI